jgi:hypothetical protein
LNRLLRERILETMKSRNISRYRIAEAMKERGVCGVANTYGFLRGDTNGSVELVEAIADYLGLDLKPKHPGR